MQLVKASFTEDQANALLVAAQAGKRIRVTQVVVTTSSTAQVTLRADPGASGTDVTEVLYVSSSPLVLRLGRRFALTLGAGEALGVTVDFTLQGGGLSVHIWYEVVE